MKTAVGLDEAIDENGLRTAARARRHDVREAQMRGNDLTIDHPPAIDLRDPGEVHRAAVGGDARLVRAAIGREGCVTLAREHIDVAAESERDRAAHAGVGPRRKSDERDRLRRCRGGARWREERRTDPYADAKIENDEHGRDPGEDELARSPHYEARSTAATIRSISPARSAPLVSSRNPSAGGSKGCLRMRS